MPAKQGSGRQEAPGRLQGARSSLIPLSHPTALTCTDSYNAEPTPYHELLCPWFGGVELLDSVLPNR
jgi:hypothetical protein